MSIQKNNLVTSEAPSKVVRLRRDLGNLSQAGLAKRLNVSRIAVVKWESGTTVPGPHNYIELAKQARCSPSLAAWFWKQAGIDESALRELLPEFKRSLQTVERRVEEMLSGAAAAEGGAVRLPLLKSTAYLSAPATAPQDEIERWVAVPADFVLRLDTTSCVRADSEYLLRGRRGAVDPRFS